MAHVPNWLLLHSLLLWSSFVAGKVVRGPEAQLCKDRGSGPTWHGGYLPPTQGKGSLTVGQPKSCVGRKGCLGLQPSSEDIVSRPSAGPLWQPCFATQSSRSEGRVSWTKQAAEQAWLRKLLGLVSCPQSCLSSQKISSWHMGRASSASVLYPNQ